MPCPRIRTSLISLRGDACLSSRSSCFIAGNNGDRLCRLVARVPGYRCRGPGYDSRRYQIVVGLERGPLSLVRIIEELREWKSCGSGSRKPRLTAVGIRCGDHATPSIRKKLALTSPRSGGCSVSIVRLRTKATEFIFFNDVMNNG
jgi:hypothetical protein